MKICKDHHACEVHYRGKVCTACVLQTYIKELEKLTKRSDRIEKVVWKSILKILESVKDP